MRIAAVLLLLPVAAGCGSPAAPASAAGQSMSSNLQAAIGRWAAESGHLGVSASVILADGTQWTGSANRAGVTDPLRPFHLISIASITKTMTAAVILQLADESRLALDDRIDRWIEPRAYVDPAITVRQLLNHTSGLDNYTATPGLGAAIAANPSRVFTADELLAFVGPPHFAPGTGTEYTNTGFVLLGQVAERITGRSIVTLWHQRLWGPLGLGEIFLPGFEPPPGPVAPALTASNGVARPLDHMASVSSGNSAFGLFASAQNVAVWGHALFTSGIVSANMQQEMRTLVPAAGNIPGESGSGLGIRGYAYLGRSQIGHSGGSAFGSGLLLHDPAARITVVVLMNQAEGADHFALAPALLQIALGLDRGLQ